MIPGEIWWRLIHWGWRQYLAALAIAVDAPKPHLGPPGASGIYFTDRESLEGCQWPASFARRLGLSMNAQSEAQRYGCAVVEFDVPIDPITNDPEADIPTKPAVPGIRLGLTVGGAREWLTRANIPLDPRMRVTYIDVTVSSDVRWFNLPL